MPETAKRWALIEGNIVANVIVWDGMTEWKRPEGSVLEEITEVPNVGIGWGYNPKATVNRWTAPPPEEDETDGDD